MTNRSHPLRLRSLLVNIGVALLASFGALVAIEGCASALLFVSEFAGGAPNRPSVAESTHTRYDAEIGWVNEPNALVEDLYAPGASVRINAQGFRNDRDFAVRKPPGRFRVICAGDSFTLGFGVAGDQTWCHQLAFDGLDLERVNMGQGGYGIDQAWLWYKRDGAPLEHDLLIFAFIQPDFGRMTRLSLRDYAKPRVRFADGRFALENVPVPRAGVLNAWLRRHRDTFGSLRVFQLVGPWVTHPLPEPDYDRFPPYSQREAFDVALEIFSDLARTTAARGARAVFVYLPSEFDLGERGQQLAPFRASLAEETQRRGLTFVDLTSEFRALTKAETDALFFDPGETQFRHAKGHYTPEGNAFVARLLSNRLAPIVAATAR